MKNNLIRVCGMSVLIALISIFGLLSALLGEGIWRGISLIAFKYTNDYHYLVYFSSL